MNLIVSVHVRPGSDAVQKPLAEAAQELASGRPLAAWADADHTVFRCQFELRRTREDEPVDKLVQRFARAAGPAATRVVVLVTHPVEAEDRTVPGEELAPIPPVPPLPAPGAIALPPPPPIPVPPKATAVRPAPETPAPVAITSPRQRAQADEAPLVELAVRACEADGLRGIVVATGQPLQLQVDGHWDVVEGEILTLRPTRFWRFARNSLASGEYVGARLDTTLFPGRPLALHRAGDAWELERPVLEGNPADPADDIVQDAEAALKRGRLADARHLARTALEADIRCLEAHDLLARTSLERGDAPASVLRRDAVLLAFAREAVQANVTARLARKAPGNAPVYAALARLERMDDARARQLTGAWRIFLA